MTTSPSDGLEGLPEALNEAPEAMPWECDYAPIAIVPFVNMRCYGQTLESLTSPQLLAVRREAERRNGSGTYFAGLIAKLDEILTARGGE